jgi:hypothetical protein
MFEQITIHPIDNPYVGGVDADGDGHAVGLLALDALDVNNELLAVHLHG